MLIAGPLVLIGLLVALGDWDRRFPWVLSASFGLPVTAALSAGGQQITAYFLLALIGVTVYGISWLRGRTPLFSWPGAGLMALFVGWCMIITLAGPTLFRGVDVLAARGGIDAQVVDPSQLTYTVSNVAQILYLVINVIVVGILATRSKLSPHLLAPGLAIVAVLSNWRLTNDKFGVPFPSSQIDTGAFTFVGNPDGEYRLRGVFPEPSGLGICSVITIVYAVLMVLQTQGRVRAFYLALIASAGVNFAYAGSGTGLAGGTVMVGLLGAYATYKAITDGRSMTPYAIAMCLAIMVALVFFREISDFVVGGVQRKIGTGSYRSRSSADSFSIGLGLKSYGLGVGLGSNRPSSLWPMLWSCTGFIGVASFLGVLVRVVLAARPALTWRPLLWALVAAVVCKTFAGSTIADPILMMAIGMAAYAALHERPAPVVTPPRVIARRQRTAPAAL